MDIESINYSVIGGTSYSNSVRINQSLPKSTQSARTKVNQYSAATHGGVHIAFCSLKEDKHCCITIRYYCPFCYYMNNTLTSLYKCSECERKVNMIDRLPLSEDNKLKRKGLLKCTHSSRSPIDGYPMQTIALHLCTLIKNDMFFNIPNCSVRQQYEIIKNSKENGLTNFYCCRNRFYCYLELGHFSLAEAISFIWDRVNYEDSSLLFLMKELSYYQSPIYNSFLDYKGTFIL